MPPLALIITCRLCKTKPWSWPELILSIKPYETDFNGVLIWNSKFLLKQITFQFNQYSEYFDNFSANLFVCGFQFMYSSNV